MEIWKDIEGYEGLYQISNLGRVYSLIRNIILKSVVDATGYLVVCLHKNKKQKNHKIHRLVGLAFQKNPHKLPQINHEDGVKTNNHYKNLKWCDAFYNQQHAVNTGLKKKCCGEDACNVKLKQSDVNYIRKNNNYKLRELAEMFNVSISNIHHIQNNNSWIVTN